MPVRALLDEAKAGLELVRAGRFVAPPATARIRRIFYGPGVFVALARAVWNDAPLRRRYLRAIVPQLVIVVAVGLLLGVGVGGDRFTFNADGAHFTTKAVKGARGWGARIAAVVAAMAAAEWLVIAFTRELHDALSFAVSSHVGVPPEEDVPNPRVRLDLDWLITKMKRRVQGGFILLATLLPLLVLYGAVASPILVGLVKGSLVAPWINTALGVVPNVAGAILGAYWLGVFTLGKTAHAWRDETVPDPFFLRFLDRGAARFPRALAPFHLYARVLRRMIGLVRRPAFLVERAPWETAGLVLTRILISVPGLYIVLRPLIPVASTVMIAARSPDTLRGLPVSLVFDERAQ